MVTAAVKPPGLKQIKNEQALKLYAAILCGFIVLVAAARWLRVICIRHSKPGPTRGGALSRAVLRAFKLLEKRPRWKWLCDQPVGMLVLFGILVVVNATLCVTVIAGLRINWFASRFGWLATANMVLCVLFGMRNTPLSSVTLVSHATINTVHRIVGYSTVALVAIHGLLYTIYFIRQGTWERLFEHGNIQGFPAGLGMLVLLMGYFRHRNYEFFYASHVLGFVATVFFTGIHRPDWAKKLPIVMIIVACMWAVERVFRAAKMAYHLVGTGLCQEAVALYPLTEGGTRLVLKSRRAHTLPAGSHCFLWVPCAGIAQSHPFTVVSSGSWGMELVIKARDGFTQRLSELAAEKPGSVSWASVDGPYGSLPDLAAHEKLVLIAGGSGAAYTFALMNHLLASTASHAKTRPQSVDFVWAVKHAAQLSWFGRHLATLKRVPEGMTINVSIFITSEGSARDASGNACTDYNTVDFEDFTDVFANAFTDACPERADELSGLLSSTSTSSPSSGDYHPAADRTPGLYSLAVKHGAMSTDVVLWDAMQTVTNRESSLVVTCGPKSLMVAVRNSVEAYRGQHRQRIVNFYCEEFS